MAMGKRWSTRWGQVAVVVVMMLAAIGTWEIVKSMAKLGGYAQADVPIADHLTCYELHVKSEPEALVLLRDQFSPSGVEAEVKKLKLLCTPAVKTPV
jgi:hypothetical protein